MNKQILALLVVISLATAAIYYLLMQPSQSNSTELLFSDLTDKAEQIERVEILNHQGTLVSATQGKDGWVTRVEATGIDYPINQQKLSELITNLKEARLYEAKTNKKENYPILGVSDIQSVDSQASLINVTASGKQYSVLVGRQASSGKGSYIRMASGKQTWLLDTLVPLPDSEFDWLKQPIVDISDEQVNFVSRVGQQAFSIQRAPQQDEGFIFEGLSESETLKYNAILAGFIDNILGLSFDQIVSLPDDFWQTSSTEPEKEVIQFEIGLQTGDMIKMTLVKSKNEHFVQFTRNESEGQVHWDGLSYLISNFDFDQINKNRADFIDSNETADSPVQAPVQAPASQAIDEGESPK